MENLKLDLIIEKLKHTFTLKQTRITLYIVLVLWVAVGAQVFMNRMFTDQVQITEAFVKSDTSKMESSLQVVAEYNKETLSDNQQKTIINNLANAIGLVIDKDITVTKDATRSESYYFKKAKKAYTQLEVSSVKEKDGQSTTIRHYIIARLNISDGISSIDKYKKELEKAFKAQDVKNIQTTLKYEGSKNGTLNKEQKHKMATMLVKDLEGKIAMEYDEGDLYTVYGYTGMLKDYVKSLGNKINIQIAITYNELTNKTTVTLATPVLNDSY